MPICPMDESTQKYPQFAAAVDAVMAAIRQDDDKAIEEAIQQLYKAQDAEMSSGVSDFEGVLLQFRGAIGAIENHLRTGDNLSALICFQELLEEYECMCAQSSFTLKEIGSIKKLMTETEAHIKRVIVESSMGERKAEEAIHHRNHSEPVVTSRPTDCCQLCGEKKSVCTGSHLAPHFLIQPFLSYNGSTRRDTEVVNETTMAGLRKERKWGRSVPSEQIDETFGGVPEAEKAEVRPSAVTRDYLFCNDCEKRFGFIETAYAESFRKHQPCSDSLLAYIFWLGVFWRLSIGKMALQLNKKDEKAIGDILNHFMPYDSKDVKSMVADGDLGSYGYIIYHCSNVKGELSGVIGMHHNQSPYWLLLGEYIVVLYSNKEQAPADHQVNDYQQGQEKWQEIPFIDYWEKKQKILNTNYVYENHHMGDGQQKIVDVVKGDHVDVFPSFMSPTKPQEIDYEDLKGKTFYQVKIPGALSKIISLTEQHPETDTVEKRYELIEKELGYTPEEMQEMFDYWNSHHSIRRVKAVSSQVKRAQRARKVKEKRKKKEQRKRRRRNRK